MESNWQIYDNFSRYRIFPNGFIFDNKLDYFIPQQTSLDGYFCVTLRNDKGKRKTFKTHRLVAELFVPNFYDKPEVNHKNGLKIDNHYSNLEWVTHAENIKHAWDTGLLSSTPARSLKLSFAHSGKNMSKDNPRAKSVICITTGEIFGSMADAARKYNINGSQISNVCCGYRNRKTAGNDLITKTPLTWAFYEE